MTNRAVLAPPAIAAAADILRGHVRVTPTIEVPASELTDQPAWADTSLVLKLEHLQHSGSFKARGAAHFLATQNIGLDGVVAASGGNHGAAVAWAATRLGHAANIFVPTIASPAKVEMLRRFGANIHQQGAMFAEAYEASTEWQASHDATAIHPYNDPVVMAGAGTASREFERQAGLLDAVLVACGGGGLSGGAASWFGTRVEVAVCETEGTATYASAIAAGGPVDVEVSGLAADALGATRLGDNPWRSLSAVDAPAVVVTDEHLADAQQRLWDRLRLVVEPSAAAPVAALIAGTWIPRARLARRVGIILCGGNTDPSKLAG